MNDDVDRLRLALAVRTPLVLDIAHYGAMNVETGGFFVAPEGDPMRVTGIALAGEKGITRAWNFFRISAEAIDRLFEWADAERLRIPAQVHSHASDAFLSQVDRREGFNVTDFISAVVPNFCMPPPEPKAWGWWIFDGNDWVEMPPPETVAGEVRVVIFDETGVHERA